MLFPKIETISIMIIYECFLVKIRGFESSRFIIGNWSSYKSREAHNIIREIFFSNEDEFLFTSNFLKYDSHYTQIGTLEK